MAKPSNTRNSLIFLSQVGVLLKGTKSHEVRKRRFYLYAELQRRFLNRRRFRLGALLDEIERRQRRKTKIIFWADLAFNLCRHFKFTGIEYFCLWYDSGPEWHRVEWSQGRVAASDSVTKTEINRRHRRKGWVQ